MIKNRPWYWLYIAILVVLFLVSSCNMAKFVPPGKQLLKRNIIQIDTNSLDVQPIYRYLKQKENTKTALIFNFHLWFYNFSHEKKGKYNRLKDWFLIYELGDIVGEPPVILDSLKNSFSLKQIEKYMNNRGYYQAQVTDSIAILGRKRNKAKVYYKIKAGQPVTLESINYKIDDDEIKRLILQNDSLSLLKKGALLDVDVLQQERLRITHLLKNNGYFLFSKEFIYYEVDTLQSNYKAQLTTVIQNFKDSVKHKKYYINQINFFNDFSPQLYLKRKEAYYQEFTGEKVDSFTFFTRKKNFVKSNVLMNACFLNKGHLYSEDLSQLTFNRLSYLNQYQLINLKYDIDPQSDSLINVGIQLTPFKRRSYSPEIELTNSSGDLGIGGRLTYSNRSLFKRAELFNFSIFGKFESQNSLEKDNNSEDLKFNNLELGINTSVDIPKFLIPPIFNTTFRRNKPKTRFDARLVYKDKRAYKMSVWGLGFGYFWKSKRAFRHQFKLMDLSSVKTYSLSKEYAESIKGTYLERAFQNYFISALNYNLFYNRGNKRRNRNTFSGILKLELAGSLLSAYQLFEKEKSKEFTYYVLNNEYAQYWRAEIDLRYHQYLNKRNRLVYRSYFGIVQPYDNAVSVPYVKQFYSGGAVGMRAWAIRSLGPGGYYNKDRKYYDEVGNLKLEANFEYRFKLFWLMEGAFFVDIGNIWSLNKKDSRPKAIFKFNRFYKQLAVGSGLGLRFDFSFFIVRIDYGIKLRDPKEKDGQRWIINHSDYNPISSKNTMFNFGIGYPF